MPSISANREASIDVIAPDSSRKEAVEGFSAGMSEGDDLTLLLVRYSGIAERPTASFATPGYVARDEA